MNLMNPIKKRVIPFSVLGKRKDALLQVEIRRGCNVRAGRQPATDNLFIIDPCISNRHAVVTVQSRSEKLQLKDMFVTITTLGKWSSLNLDLWSQPFSTQHKIDNGDTLTLYNGDTFGLVKTTAEFKGWEIVYTKLRYQVFITQDQDNSDNFYLVVKDITQDSNWSMLMLPTGLDGLYGNLTSQNVVCSKMVKNESNKYGHKNSSGLNNKDSNVLSMLGMYILGILTILFLLAINNN